MSTKKIRLTRSYDRFGEVIYTSPDGRFQVERHQWVLPTAHTQWKMTRVSDKTKVGYFDTLSDVRDHLAEMAEEGEEYTVEGKPLPEEKAITVRITLREYDVLKQALSRRADHHSDRADHHKNNDDRRKADRSERYHGEVCALQQKLEEAMQRAEESA